MKKFIASLSLGAVLVAGFLVVQETQQEDSAFIGEREPSIYSIEQPSYFF